MPITRHCSPCAAKPSYFEFGLRLVVLTNQLVHFFTALESLLDLCHHRSYLPPIHL